MGKAMVLASFLGDSLALGAHWIYDPRQIVQDVGRVDSLLAPQPGSYHSGKAAGQFTHYGDQTMLLLEHLAAAGRFEPAAFAAAWHDFMSGYAGYMDHATKATLANMKSRPLDAAGSESADLAGAARIAPLVYALRQDAGAMVAAVRAQTRLTHDHPKVVDAAEFLARAALAALEGETPLRALETAAQAAYATDMRGALAQGLASAGQDTVAAIGAFGQSCHVDGALRGVIHCIARHPADLREALVNNVMAGGDSAARGLLVGMVLGAALGEAALPVPWLAALQAKNRIVDLLERL